MSAQRWKKWLRRRLNKYSPSAALRWMYRLGFRKGKLRGIEIGESHVPPILNQCTMHNLPIYPRIVQVADGRWVEMWCCPRWDEHTMHDLAQPVQQVAFPDVERFTDKMHVRQVQFPGRPLQAFNQAIQHGAGPHTAATSAIPRRTVKLSEGHDRRLCMIGDSDGTRRQISCTQVQRY